MAISVGCNNTCTFCIVPTTRGKEHDRRPGDILAEIRQCVDEGAKEVTLLGQNVNSFGYGIGDRFAFSKLCLLYTSYGTQVEVRQFHSRQAET